VLRPGFLFRRIFLDIGIGRRIEGRRFAALELLGVPKDFQARARARKLERDVNGHVV